MQTWSSTLKADFNVFLPLAGSTYSVLSTMPSDSESSSSLSSLGECGGVPGVEWKQGNVLKTYSLSEEAERGA